jgi:hypothetical protein
LKATQSLSRTVSCGCTRVWSVMWLPPSDRWLSMMF